MIISIEGVLVSATPLLALVETQGFGYEVHIPVTTAERLPSPGTVVKLHTLAVYREDSQTLYGFSSSAERDFFRLLVEKVTGVGPKVAISIMSRLSLPVLQSAIAAGDVDLLAKCPGIGRKTAERLVVELRDKLASLGVFAPHPIAPGTEPDRGAESQIGDAVLALTALGYKAPDADKAVRRARAALGPGASLEDLVRKALG